MATLNTCIFAASALSLTLTSASLQKERLLWPTKARVAGARVESRELLPPELLHPTGSDPTFRLRLKRQNLATFRMRINYRNVEITENDYKIEDPRKDLAEEIDASPVNYQTPEGYFAVEVIIDGQQGDLLLTNGEGIAQLSLPPGLWLRLYRGETSTISISYENKPVLSMRLGQPEAQEFVRSLESAGNFAIDKGDLTAALTLFSRVITIDPGSASGYEGRGWALAGLFRYKEAQSDLTKALSLGSTTQRQLRYASILFDLGELPSAGKVADEILTHRPHDLSLLMEAACLSIRASMRQHAGNLMGALGDMNKALQIRPEKRAFYLKRASVYDGLNDGPRRDADLATAHAITADDFLSLDEPDLASEEAEQAVTLGHGQLVSPYLMRGRIHRIKGEIWQAGQDFETAIGLNPRDASAHYDMGFLFFSSNKFVEANQELTRAILLKPTHTPALKLRAFCSLMQEKPRDALQDLQGMHLDTDIEVLIGFLEAELQLHDKRAASGYAATLERIATQDALASFEAGKARFLSEDLLPAIEDLDRSISAHQTSEGYSLRAMAKLGIGDFVGSLNDFELSTTSEPSAWPLYVARMPASIIRFSWGAAAYQSGLYETSLKHFNEAIASDEDFAEAYLGRARARQRMIAGARLTVQSVREMRQVLSDLKSAAAKDAGFSIELRHDIDFLQSRLGS